MSHVSFANDSRLQYLSPKARDLLARILEAFPHDDLFGSGVPATPAQLRLTLYRSDDPRLDPDIGRQLKELELSSIIILRRDTRKIRSLKLTLDFSGAPEGPLRTAFAKPDAPAVIPVIHNPAGLSPPGDPKKIAVVAATAISSSDLVQKLQPYFPRHDVSLEYSDYHAHRTKIGRPAVALIRDEPRPGTFVHWMMNAAVRLGRLKRPRTNHQHVEAANPAVESQLDLFDEQSRSAFLRQYEEQKKVGSFLYSGRRRVISTVVEK